MDWNITFLMILMILAAVTNGTEYQANGNQLTCIPFGALILWDRSTDKDIFYIQRHYVARIITNTPENTNIRLYTTGSSFQNIIDEKIKNTDKRWIENIGNVTNGMFDQSISYTQLMQVISKDNEKTEGTSKQIFFVIDKNSKITNEEGTMKKLSKYKVFVVYIGTKLLSFFWTHLSTDTTHLVKVSSAESGDVHDFLKLSCHDSRLYCDTDMYWNGTMCYRCSFICSRVPSEYCQMECPYFDEFALGVQNTNNHQNALDSSNSPLLIIIVILQITMPLIICVVLNEFKSIKQFITRKAESFRKQIRTFGINGMDNNGCLNSRRSETVVHFHVPDDNFQSHNANDGARPSDSLSPSQNSMTAAKSSNDIATKTSKKGGGNKVKRRKNRPKTI